MEKAMDRDNFLSPDKGSLRWALLTGLSRGICSPGRTIMEKKKLGSIINCNFCGKSQKEVGRLIAGPNVYICDECVDLCSDIVHEENDIVPKRVGSKTLPRPPGNQGSP